MTPEQIEQWAREARMCCNFEWVAGIRTLTSFDATTATLTRFAELVAQAEREMCERACATIAHDLRNHDVVRMTAAKCMDAIRNSKQGGEVG